jgi:hypothetical protein
MVFLFSLAAFLNAEFTIVLASAGGACAITAALEKSRYKQE